MMILLVMIMGLASITLILLAVGLTMKSERQIMMERVRKYGYEEATQAPALTDDLLPSFAERIVHPLARRFARLGGSMTPSQGRVIESFNATQPVARFQSVGESHVDLAFEGFHEMG